MFPGLFVVCLLSMSGHSSAEQLAFMLSGTEMNASSFGDQKFKAAMGPVMYSTECVTGYHV